MHECFQHEAAASEHPLFVRYLVLEAACIVQPGERVKLPRKVPAKAYKDCSNCMQFAAITLRTEFRKQDDVQDLIYLTHPLGAAQR